MKVLRIFFGFCCLLFVLFTYWQLNDPDAWLWVSIYGFAAVMSGLAAYGKYPVFLLCVAAVLCFAGFVYDYPSSVSDWVRQEWLQKDLSMKTHSMELARESFGLLIAGLVMIAAAVTGYVRNRLAGPQEVRNQEKHRTVA